MRLPLAVTLSLACTFLSACGQPTPTELHEEYIDATRAVGVIPVVPPRGDLRVGDIYLRTFDPDAPTNRHYLGRITELEQFATFINEDRAPYHSPAKTASGIDLLSQPFRSTVVDAATAASFGAVLPTTRGLFNFGRRKRVALNFHDTRVFGADPTYPPTSGYINKITPEQCKNLGAVLNRVLRQSNYRCNTPNECIIQVVAKLDLTRKITYNDATTTGTGAGIAPTVDTPTPAASAPLIAVISPAVAPGAGIPAINAPAAPSAVQVATGISYSGGQSTVSGYELPEFLNYVAVGYQSINFEVPTVSSICLTKGVR